MTLCEKLLDISFSLPPPPHFTLSSRCSLLTAKAIRFEIIQSRREYKSFTFNASLLLYSIFNVTGVGENSRRRLLKYQYEAI